MQEYFEALRSGLGEAYLVAAEARKKGADPEGEVEIKIAEDVAGRVEGIVGPPGIAVHIRALEQGGMARTLVAYEIVKRICDGEFDKGKNKEKLIDQAVRTGVGILTEGVLVAPTEGIARIRIMQNPDESDYLAIYFAGPIRSAGGTVAALAVVLGDAARSRMGVGDYRATDSEIERIVEECEVYDARGARLQYKPPEEHMRHIVKNCPVCIEGDPTEEVEVAVHRDMKKFARDRMGKTVSEDITNRVRGGIALVVCEGIAQKASKVLKYTKSVSLDWGWLEKVIRVGKGKEVEKIAPNSTYLDDLVAGRPIFSYPMEPGGFRLRYGRTRASGIMGKAVHPATMIAADSFLAIGTQMKLERPGKGCIVSPCDTIEGPVVKLKDGTVVKLKSVEAAVEKLYEIEEILFLGDLLVPVGDFIKSNHPLVPSAWCFEWYAEICRQKGISAKEKVGAEDAFKISREHSVPLHPDYTYFWHDINEEELFSLAEYLSLAKMESEWFALKKIVLPNRGEKRVLEKLCVEHGVSGKNLENVEIEKEDAVALLKTLGMLHGGKVEFAEFEKKFGEFKGKGVMKIINESAGVVIKEKSPIYVGARMGRPEKAKKREMRPAVHVLFPLGQRIKHRSVLKTYKALKESPVSEGRGVNVEVARLKCPQCGKVNVTKKCACGAMCGFAYVCPKCKKERREEFCLSCDSECVLYEERAVDLEGLFDEAKRACGNNLPSEVKGVKGLISASKIPERLEKGILRARHGVSVFRDGTCRFDATDVPLTHFYPNEVGVGVEKLKSLGYTHDYEGKELKNEGQLLELRAQDVLISDEGAEYFINVANFIDEMLVCLYGMKPFYNVKGRGDLVGKFFVGLSPHTSAGVLCRLVGFTKAHVGYAHPYFHTAKRRNADGDEDSLMLLLDALLDFSMHFVPKSRGGTMDAPRVLTAILDPNEVDDEVHSMEICSSLPLEFFDACEKYLPPSEAKLKLVKDTLGTEEQYKNLLFTHHTSSIQSGAVSTTYIKFKDMGEKVDAQLALEKKIRAVDERNVAERIILSHFLPDLYGNLRAFSRQMFRCVSCNAKYRRVPLVGKCTKCGEKLLLTVNKGGIEKYLQMSKRMCVLYDLPNYLKQRLDMLEEEIRSIFIDEKSKQSGLAEFM
ncbi:DNA polymerase II large subunit [Candidatus Micrarchaeota archaeon CG1_02_47_40]|nr:MAG: DNA polymerase II large subunit [Candidatus Micrarchaeota archaeon CG1_02_47_40]